VLRCVVLLSAAIALPVPADERPRLQVDEQVQIDAEPVQVWNLIKDFDGLHRWHPLFASARISDGSNNVPGAIRELQVRGGPSFFERLLYFSEAQMGYSYEITWSPLPLDGYSATVSVYEDGSGGSRVRWDASFTRKSASATPAAGEDDAAALHLVTGVYRAGLVHLKALAEGRTE
jgi:mxaD protein